jgi:biotin operon repressor
MSGETKDWIRKNMTQSEDQIIQKNREEISKLVGLTKEGRVVFLADKREFKAGELVALYLIGKLMAKIAEYSPGAVVGNAEVSSELGIPSGTVGRTLSELKDKGWVRKSEDQVGYEIVLSSIPSILNEIRGRWNK